MDIFICQRFIQLGSFFNYLFLFHLLYNIPCRISMCCPNQWSVVSLISYHIEVFWEVVSFILSFYLSLSCCVVVSLSSSIIFGPTLCPPGIFGGVTLLLSCDFLSEAFFAAELIISDICCSPEKFDKCGYVGLFVAKILRLPPKALSASCTTSSCVGGAGRSYVYFCGGKNTTVSDILYAPVVGTQPL